MTLTRERITEIMNEPLSNVFKALYELDIQNKEYAAEIYRLIQISYGIGFNVGFSEAMKQVEKFAKGEP